MLPPLSPSSQILPLTGRNPSPFNFQFFIHQPSGALLLVPEDVLGLLEAVCDAKHREPEAHLEAATDFLLQALSESGNTQPVLFVQGVTDKDLSLVQTISERIQPSSSNEILLPGMHTLEAQELISRSPENLECKPGAILILRHLLEHAHNLDTFLQGLAEILRDDGICLIEVPDTTALLAGGDLTQLWEEHMVYFTSSSLKRALQHAGFEVLAHQSMISDGEDLCLAIIRRSRMPYCFLESDSVDDLSKVFLRKIWVQLHQVKDALVLLSNDHAIYLFGANHIGGLFLDLIADQANLINGVIDDDPEKANCSISLARTAIIPLESICRARSIHILVAVNEGRAPDLYERLRIDLPEFEGHRVESLVSFLTNCWQKIQ